jgi:phosphoribosylaminoimidazolecarboxamide formyltransferase / IMP cyclohydrolase
MAVIRRVLLSVTDKSGLLAFAQGLSRLGAELISTGGTARLLRQSGMTVQDVSDLTGFPEMLDGRVKTIHPRVAAGILAMRAKAGHMESLAAHEIPLIDMVVVNLYDFASIARNPGAHVEELIENIDIGGPTMIRAAAKNYQDVAVVTSPDDYEPLLSELNANGASLSPETHWSLARKAFALTGRYDQAITERLARVGVSAATQDGSIGLGMPPILDIHIPRRQELRYGENPHQEAALYAQGTAGIAGCRQLQGKELSFNNLVDLDAAWHLVLEFDDPATAVIKHTNPCGCAQQATLAASYRKADEADTVSAFGGVLAFNRELDEETTREVAKLFVEAIVAPGYSEAALAILSGKKNVRVVVAERPAAGELMVKSISGGLLAQTPDDARLDLAKVEIRTTRSPTNQEREALSFAWRVVKHVKSNAIVYARAGQLLSAGAGQMSRVDSVKFGAAKAMLPLAGAVLASDAFFPFPDGIEEAARHGITAVIQPGGSVRDTEVIEAADRLGLAMVFTRIRHFRH